MKKNIILLASAMLVLSACDKQPAISSVEETHDITLKTNKDGEERNGFQFKFSMEFPERKKKGE